jgi:outer membrane protein assembly factor BamB
VNSLGRSILWSGFLAACAALLLFFVRDKTVRPPVPPAPVRVLWTFEPPERGAVISSPLAAGDRLYVGAIRDAALHTSGAVYCLDRTTGKPVWTFDNDGEMLHMYSSPCLADASGKGVWNSAEKFQTPFPAGRLYIGDGMHANFVCHLYCLDAASGNRLWQFETGGHIESSPCFADGKVYFGSGDDGIYCLDAVTGERRWQFQAGLHVDTSPAVVSRRLYGGSGVSRTRKNPAIFCLAAADGRVRWQWPTDLAVWGSPAVDGEQVFFGLGNGRLTESVSPPEKPAGALLCVDAGSGVERWRYAVGDGVLARPTLDAERVYFSARDGFCYAVSRRTGDFQWRVDLGSAIVTTPVLLDGRLYIVGSGGRVSCLAAENGQAFWTFDVAEHSQTKPQCLSSPAVVREGDGRRIYFGSELRGPTSSAAVVYCLAD